MNIFKRIFKKNSVSVKPQEVKPNRRPCVGAVKCMLEGMELADVGDYKGFVIIYDNIKKQYTCVGLYVEYLQVGALRFKNELSTTILARTLELNRITLDELDIILKEAKFKGR